MSLRRLVQAVVGALVLLAMTTAVLIGVAAARRRTLVELQRTRFISYQLADELRQSSDDLTRFARTYVVTGDPRFEQYYRDVLAIRSGDKPRPVHYERIYWDLFVDAGRPPGPDGAAVPLRRLMQQAGFTDQELARLREAEVTSNALVEIEETAMRAIKGQYRDSTGAFTREAPPDRALAVRLMHDATYHQEKARIMAPIGEFLAMIETRTASELDEFNRDTAVAFTTIEAALAVFLGLMLLSYPGLRKRVLLPIAVLQRQTESVAVDLERLAGVTTRIGRGDLNQSFTVSAVPIRSARQDEIGHLSRVHDSMIGQLQGTGTAIAAITAELSEARHRLEEILNTTPIGVVVAVDGICKYANPRFHELFGSSVGEPIADLYANAGDRGQMLEELRQRGMIRDRVVEARTKDGRRLDVLCTYYPIEFDGQAGILGWIVDVTKMKDTEKALEEAKHVAEAATRAKSAFLATMSHEIRTPMNAVLGYAQLFRRDRSLTPAQRQKVDAILSSGEHLLTLINNVLEMSRIEAGRSVLVTESVDLHQLLDGIEQMFAGLARQKGLELRFQRNDHLPNVVDGDPGKIRQIVINLLSNAVKFTKHGRVTLRASAERIPHRGHRITVAVEDTGPGIEHENLGRVFGAFEQSSSGARAGGTGLGLAIGRELARLMSGDLTVASTVGVGSTFTFTFEAGAVSAGTARGAAGGLPVGLAAGQPRRRILVVDDSRENTAIVGELLTGVGFDARAVSSGEEAIAVHDAWRPDLVLMDLRMPGLNGLEAIRQLRTAGSTAVLVIFTASVLEEIDEDVRNAGGNGLLRKPYREADLLRAIGEWLGVKYVYENDDTPAPRVDSGRADAPSLRQLLAEVPSSLVEQLRDAAVQARAARIETLAGQIAEYSADAAAGIREFARDFRYDDLAAAL